MSSKNSKAVPAALTLTCWLAVPKVPGVSVRSVKAEAPPLPPVAAAFTTSGSSRPAILWNKNGCSKPPITLSSDLFSITTLAALVIPLLPAPVTSSITFSLLI